MLEKLIISNSCTPWATAVADAYYMAVDERSSKNFNVLSLYEGDAGELFRDDRPHGYIEEIGGQVVVWVKFDLFGFLPVVWEGLRKVKVLEKLPVEYKVRRK